MAKAWIWESMMPGIAVFPWEIGHFRVLSGQPDNLVVPADRDKPRVLDGHGFGDAEVVVDGDHLAAMQNKVGG